MITLLFSGDFAPIIPIENIYANHFAELSEIFARADLHVTNLECPLTSSTEPIEKTGPSIKADPLTISLLQQAKVDVVCLANNHIFDYGEEGIVDTLTLCENHNIETIGIISREAGQNHWLIREIKGKKIGILNYCEHEFSVREKGLLGANGYDPVNAYYDVIYLRPIVDYLIVIYHGGNEYYNLPRPELKKDFHYLADLGADAVIGHHTHVISGYEIYNEKPLVYSLGNFFFPFDEEPESWHEGVLCQLKIEGTIGIELIPVLQCKGNLAVVNLRNEERGTLLKRIEILSEIIGDDDGLQSNWNTYVRAIGDGLANKILFPTVIDKIISRVPILNKYVNNIKNRRSILNILRCISLRQVLINNLNSKICS